MATSKISESDIEEVNGTFSEYISFFRDFIIILVVVILIRIFIVTPFQINGQSMESSYHNKEFILVDKLSYLNFSSDMQSYRDNPTWGWMIQLWQSIPVHIGDPKR